MRPGDLFPRAAERVRGGSALPVIRVVGPRVQAKEKKKTHHMLVKVQPGNPVQAEYPLEFVKVPQSLGNAWGEEKTLKIHSEKITSPLTARRGLVRARSEAAVLTLKEFSETRVTPLIGGDHGLEE